MIRIIADEPDFIGQVVLIYHDNQEEVELYI